MLDTKPDTSFKGGRGEGAAALLNCGEVGGSTEGA